MPKFLVTGGAGFVGSNLVKQLVGNNEEVLVVDDLSTGHLDNLKEARDKIEFVRASSGDCLQLGQVKDLKGIFHLGIPSSSPLYKENHCLVGKSINDFIAILDLAKRENCKLVFASTSSVYNGNPVPFKEEMPVFPKDFYSEARYYMERLAKIYFELWQVKSIGLRLFSIYGPGEEHKKELANLVSQFLWQMQKNEKPLIFGNGEQTRDFVFVKDALKAFLLAMSSSIQAGIFNVGTGRNYNLKQLVSILNDVLGKSIQPEYQENFIQNYVSLHLADVQKAKDELSFEAEHSLEQGIKEILRYNQQH